MVCMKHLTRFEFSCLLTILSLGLIVVGCRPHPSNINDTPPPIATLPGNTPAPPLRREVLSAEVGLIIALEFAPDGRLFYAEKSGGVYTQNVLDSVTPPTRLLSLDVAEGSENGLLGLTLSPDFAQTGYFYVYYNVPNEEKAPIESRIARYKEANNQIIEETIIIADLPASPEQSYHFGGALSFGPDGKLYLIFGDRNMPQAARDPTQLPGSILRYNPNGAIPADNPFPNSPVYAYGIRNGFGLAWHPQTGQLYETENGASCDDELNLILPGADYGWGVHTYDTCPYPDDTGESPLYQWPSIVAPTDLTFYTSTLMPEFQGDFLVCGFNESKLFHFHLGEDGRSVKTVSPVEIPGVYELCRVSLVQGPDGWIYAATSQELHRIGR